MQRDQAKMQLEVQLEQMRQQHETQMKAQELAQKEQFDRWKAELDAATKIMVARISANPGLDIPALERLHKLIAHESQAAWVRQSRRNILEKDSFLRKIRNVPDQATFFRATASWNTESIWR